MKVNNVELPHVNKYTSRMVALCEERMEHCMATLKAAGDKAVTADFEGQFINYPGGHFSRPVYNCMNTFVNNHEINPMVVEQCLRQMFDGKHDDKELFYFLTEMALIYAK